MVFNEPFGDPKDEPKDRYGASYQYRTSGAKRAVEYGAVAMLVRSRTDYSLYTPHAGSQYYGNATQIPAAAITAEDSRILARHYKKGESQSHISIKFASRVPAPRDRWSWTCHQLRRLCIAFYVLCCCFHPEHLYNDPSFLPFLSSQLPSKVQLVADIIPFCLA